MSLSASGDNDDDGGLEAIERKPRTVKNFLLHFPLTYFLPSWGGEGHHVRESLSDRKGN